MTDVIVEVPVPGVPPGPPKVEGPQPPVSSEATPGGDLEPAVAAKQELTFTFEDVCGVLTEIRTAEPDLFPEGTSVAGALEAFLAGDISVTREIGTDSDGKPVTITEGLRIDHIITRLGERIAALSAKHDRTEVEESQLVDLQKKLTFLQKNSVSWNDRHETDVIDSNGNSHKVPGVENPAVYGAVQILAEELLAADPSLGEKAALEQAEKQLSSRLELAIDIPKKSTAADLETATEIATRLPPEVGARIQAVLLKALASSEAIPYAHLSEYMNVYLEQNSIQKDVRAVLAAELELGALYMRRQELIYARSKSKAKSPQQEMTLTNIQKRMDDLSLQLESGKIITRPKTKDRPEESLDISNTPRLLKELSQTLTGEKEIAEEAALKKLIALLEDVAKPGSRRRKDFMDRLESQISKEDAQEIEAAINKTARDKIKEGARTVGTASLLVLLAMILMSFKEAFGGGRKG